MCQQSKRSFPAKFPLRMPAWVYAAPAKLRAISRKRRQFLFFITLIVLMEMGAVFFRVSLRNSADAQYWSQVITGNWSPQQPVKNYNLPNDGYISDKEYVTGLVIATVINFGPYAIMLSVLAGLFERTGKMMKVKQALDAFEETTKANLLVAFTSDEPGFTQDDDKDERAIAIAEATSTKIEACFKQAQSSMMAIIEEAFGKQDANAWRAILNRDVMKLG